MEAFIETLKLVGAIAGPILAAMALLYQRIKEAKEAQTTADVSLSQESRHWLAEFRAQVQEVKAEALAAKAEATALRAEHLRDQQAIRELQAQLIQLQKEYSLKLNALEAENTILRREVVQLRKENDELRVQVNRIESNGGNNVRTES